MPATKLIDMYPGTTKKFNITCKIDGVAQNITADTVTVTIKEDRADIDSAALLQEDADVTTQGASGVAIFELTPLTTAALTEGKRYLDIKWVLNSGEEYVVHDQEIWILERVSDEPSA